MKIKALNMGMELIDCEQTLLQEIADPSCKRLDIAKTYALTIKSSEQSRVDWAKVNKAIETRWSCSALDWIKHQAWSGRAFKK